MKIANPDSVEVLLPAPLDHGFDYAAPPGMNLSPGAYVRVNFGSRDAAGVVWKKGDQQGKLKSVVEHYAHLPPMSDAMRKFLDWTAWYNCAARGMVVKMALPVPGALKLPGSRERPPISANEAKTEARELSPDQLYAVERMREKFSAGFSATLLDGVTGSGKTEVYFELIADLLKGKKGQALVLLPEISLSIQWLNRFSRRFGTAPYVWHSGLPPARRKHTWRAIVSGEARVVVGARSALFLPYRDLHLIVVDEEHDGSYKQEEGVIYQARDLSVVRARMEKIPVLLVSATPSLETHHNVAVGRYDALHLHARHGGAEFPHVEMIDMRRAELERGAFISNPLRRALAETVAKGHQAMLFLNRRGYAPLLLCRTCGHRFQCPECTSWLVLHQRGKRHEASGMVDASQASSLKPHAFLQCHHCGFTLKLPERCPACKSENTLFPCGPGVERIAEETAEFLRQARICVMASDSADTQALLEQRIEAMERGEVDILIGTQMIAKGHHFANLALVGVVDADLGLGGGDLRAGEHTYQLLHQLSGRAGRENVPGRVLMQSFQPEHPVMQALVSGERNHFLNLELEERRKAAMPPFTRLAALIVEGVKEESTERLSRELARIAPKLNGISVLGPAPAPLFRLRGKYRYRLLVKAERQVNVQQVIRDWLKPFKFPANMRVRVDIDPYSFL